MKITRQVILDLLPLYMANEVSEETRAIIEEYLKTDPQLAESARQAAPAQSPQDVPVALTQDAELRAYKKAKLSLIWRIVVLASVMSIILVALLVAMMFFRSSASVPSTSTLSHITSETSQQLAELEPETSPAGSVIVFVDATA